VQAAKHSAHGLNDQLAGANGTPPGTPHAIDLGTPVLIDITHDSFIVAFLERPVPFPYNRLQILKNKILQL